MSQAVLSVHDVEKQFSTVKAVDRLSFQVRPGEIFALLGPNGAGKTTMVRMLMGIIRPDRGEVSWDLETRGTQPRPHPRRLGYLPEERGLYKDVAVDRILTYFGLLRGMRRRDAHQAALDWLERLGLEDRAKDKLDTLSKGNQQKVQFISAILHEPDFAVLDEPFAGLDPVNQDIFLDLLRQMSRSGMTILLSAHQMELVERLADRLLLLHRGRPVLDGSLEEIKKGAAASKLVLSVGNPDADLDTLARHPAIHGVERNGREITFLIEKGASLSDLLVDAGNSLEILNIRSERLSLHDIFVRTVGSEPSPPSPDPVEKAI